MSPYRDKRDRTAAGKRWQREHEYVQMNTWVPAELRDRVNAYNKREGISRREFFERALVALECADV